MPENLDTSILAQTSLTTPHLWTFLTHMATYHKQVWFQKIPHPDVVLHLSIKLSTLSGVFWVLYFYYHSVNILYPVSGTAIIPVQEYGGKRLWAPISDHYNNQQREMWIWHLVSLKSHEEKPYPFLKVEPDPCLPPMGHLPQLCWGLPRNQRNQLSIYYRFYCNDREVQQGHVHGSRGRAIGGDSQLLHKCNSGE